MIKPSLITVLLLLAISCTKEPKISEFSDDYVLIEFAAKLEEENIQIYPEPLAKRGQQPTE